MPSNPTPLKRYEAEVRSLTGARDVCLSTDVAALEAERDALKTEVQSLRGPLLTEFGKQRMDLEAERDALKTEVERLKRNLEFNEKGAKCLEAWHTQDEIEKASLEAALAAKQSELDAALERVVELEAKVTQQAKRFNEHQRLYEIVTKERDEAESQLSAARDWDAKIRTGLRLVLPILKDHDCGMDCGVDERSLAACPVPEAIRYFEEVLAKGAADERA